MDLHEKRRAATMNKERLAIEKQEKKLAQAALGAKPPVWKTGVESRIPEKVYAGLESAFCKGFGIVFEQGRTIIEKGYKKEDLQADYAVLDFAVQRKGGRKELKKLHKSAGKTNFLNMAATTVEGVGLGAFGIGLPDVVLFLGTLLKGIYETALHYGFNYESRQERFLILKMMETALGSGENWALKNAEVDRLIMEETLAVTDEMLREQTRETASVFAADMLLLRFVQGIPVVGVLGGMANPAYYNKVIRYVRLKYRKRYLLKQI